MLKKERGNVTLKKKKEKKRYIGPCHVYGEVILHY